MPSDLSTLLAIIVFTSAIAGCLLLVSGCSTGRPTLWHIGALAS